MVSFQNSAMSIHSKIKAAKTELEQLLVRPFPRLIGVAPLFCWAQSFGSDRTRTVQTLLAGGSLSDVGDHSGKSKKIRGCESCFGVASDKDRLPVRR